MPSALAGRFFTTRATWEALMSYIPYYKEQVRKHLEKEMATHSSVLAWIILWTGEPGGLLSTGSHRVKHN